MRLYWKQQCSQWERLVPDLQEAAVQDIDAFIRLREVERLTGLSKSSIYRLEALSDFPKRVKLSARASAWKASEVTKWLSDRPRAASARPAA